MPGNFCIMPTKSDRVVLLEQFGTIIKQLILDGHEKSEDFKEIVELNDVLTRSRNLKTREPIPKTRAFFEIIWDLPDDQFRLIARMNREAFVNLVKKLEPANEFYSYGTKWQAPVWKQLLLVLNRLGCEGNGAAMKRHAIFHGVSYGTVDKYTERVIAALLRLEGQYLRWPDPWARRGISRRFARDYGLPGAVGIIDGTPVHFWQRPGIDGENFFTRKSRYSINLQLVTDDKKRILFYYTGWPGSCYDSTVLDTSNLILHHQQYFEAGEYILADAGYVPKAFICTPYRSPAALLPENKVFNELFSSCRVGIEHVNGILKARFNSLKGIRIQIKKKKDFVKVNRWIIATLILHNFLIDQNEADFEDDDDDDSDEDMPDLVHIDMPDNQDDAALTLRARVQRHLLAWHFANNPNLVR